jgi:AcrR family transcriptional regulator
VGSAGHPPRLQRSRPAARLGIRAPSLYKHLSDKAAVEAAIIASGFEDIAAALQAALDAAPDAAAEPLAVLAGAYRAFALAHPHLYRLMTDRPLPRDDLPAGVEASAAAPLLRVVGNQELARAVWAFAHGMVQLELARRFPPDADLDTAWREGT